MFQNRSTAILAVCRTPILGVHTTGRMPVGRTGGTPVLRRDGQLRAHLRARTSGTSVLGTEAHMPGAPGMCR